MKKLSPLFDEAYRHVYIKWHAPVKLDENWKEYSNLVQNDMYLYKLIAKRKDNYRLLYIGMTEKQLIHERLFNKDHQIKQQYMKEANKGWPIYSSIGEFHHKAIEDKKSFDWAEKNVKIIEKMLIIAHSENTYLQNKKEINWFSSVGAWIKITNSGFLADNMHKIISYGLSYEPSSK